MTIGPPVYLDRPLYQYAYESLRWFDHWLKGIDTGILEEPPIHLFIVGSNEWKHAEQWPLPETKWTPFYLHANGLLSEHEFWSDDGSSTYEDSPQCHGEIEFKTPPVVENTEICGPIVLNLYGSTTATEILWFISLWHFDAEGQVQLADAGLAARLATKTRYFRLEAVAAGSCAHRARAARTRPDLRIQRRNSPTASC